MIYAFIIIVCKTNYSVNIEETELAQTPFVQERKPRIASPEIAPEKVEKIMPEESVKYSEPDKKVNSEQLMIQQMSLMTQMMGIMAGNMQQKAEPKQKSDEPEVTRIPVRDSMYRRSQR